MNLVSVICSTYNEPRFLELVLVSLMGQKFRDFELIIADDGSKKETESLIKKYQSICSFPIIHLWHEDVGYRKATIHNIAISKARGDLLVFIDGDVVLSPDFLQEHHDVYCEEHARDYLLIGRRIDLGPKVTSTLTCENLQRTLLNAPSWSLFSSYLRGETRNVLRSFSIHHPLLRLVLKADRPLDLLGCNFSLKKSTIISVNGFNEDFKSYWGEDGDLFIRLRNLGCKLISRKYFIVQYHLYHERRAPTKAHEEEYSKRIQDFSYKWCVNGLERPSN